MKSALQVLKETSRTFYIPIATLPPGLKEAVASGYLCMRAIDEVEDHPSLPTEAKATILRKMSLALQASRDKVAFDDFSVKAKEWRGDLPEVSLRMAEWANYAPSDIGPRIWEATATMADRMAYWAERNWTIETEEDLDAYTMSVAGSVGLMLSDLWQWYDNTKTDRILAVGFGRGLQSVNILRNMSEDQGRGVNFYPKGWGRNEMDEYSNRNLEMADEYTASLPKGPAKTFCQIPLTLAHGSLNAMRLGRAKLTRQEVMDMLKGLLPVFPS